MTDPRYLEMKEFATAFGCDLATLHMIAGDASHRKYYRAQTKGRSVIFMDAPPDKGEDVTPFVTIANYLRRIGLSAPDVLDTDTNKGFLALEDLGDDLFARVIEQNPTHQQAMYQAATDVLVHLHQQDPAPLPRYDGPLMAELAALSFKWYRRGVVGHKEFEDAAALHALFQNRFQRLEGAEVVVHRDYHAENLLWLPYRDGLGQVGILDFQDAMLGPSAYDLVSILQDARRDVPQEIQTAMFARYCRDSGQAEAALRQGYHLCGLQRNLRILGVFARLSMRDRKPHYIAFIPRVWGFIERNLAALSDDDLREAVMSALPAPTPDRLETLAQVTV